MPCHGSYSVQCHGSYSVQCHGSTQSWAWNLSEQHAICSTFSRKLLSAHWEWERWRLPSFLACSLHYIILQHEALRTMTASDLNDPIDDIGSVTHYTHFMHTQYHNTLLWLWTVMHEVISKGAVIILRKNSAATVRKWSGSQRACHHGQCLLLAW